MLLILLQVFSPAVEVYHKHFTVSLCFIDLLFFLHKFAFSNQHLLSIYPINFIWFFLMALMGNLLTLSISEYLTVTKPSRDNYYCLEMWKSCLGRLAYKMTNAWCILGSEKVQQLSLSLHFTSPSTNSS